MSGEPVAIAMEVEATTPPASEPSVPTPPPVEPVVEEDEEPVTDLVELLESAEDLEAAEQIPVLSSILLETEGRYGPKATSVKERAVYAVTRAYCAAGKHVEVVNLLTGDVCSGFFENVTKAKCAKVVRAVLDIVCAVAPTELEMQADMCRSIIDWTTTTSKRTFLRQRVEAKLASADHKSEVDISGMLSGRQGVKYAGTDIEAMSAIAAAASRRSLKEFQEVTTKFKHELQDDLLIKHHLNTLYEQLLESNLGKGQLIVYEESEKDMAMEKGLQVIANMDQVVTSLFVRSRALRTMMA
eukprot:scaffold71493_cov46-Attheya_sp.AAC.1